MDKLAINSRETQVVAANENVKHLAAAAQRERDIPDEARPGNWDDWGTLRVNLQVLQTACGQAIRQIELTMEKYKPGGLNEVSEGVRPAGPPEPADMASVMDALRAGLYQSDHGLHVDSSDNDNDSGEIYVDAPHSNTKFLVKVNQTE